MSRATLPLRADFFVFFPPCQCRRRRHPVSCSAVMSVPRCHPSRAAPHTYGGAVATCVAMAEPPCGAPLRPSNNAVPSSRPMQKAGGVSLTRQGAPGSGEGQHTLPEAAIAVSSGARAGGHSSARAQGDTAYARRGVPRRSHVGHLAGSLQAPPLMGPVRRQAHPLCGLRAGGTSPDQTPPCA